MVLGQSQVVLRAGILRSFPDVEGKVARWSCHENPLARHRRCDVYCGARETVGESSVSSGCWGEDSNHEYGWARRTPTYVAPIRFFAPAFAALKFKIHPVISLPCYN